MTSISVETGKQGHVGEVRFARPPHNYASAELVGLIADAIDSFDADDEVRCIVLSSDGKSFCAGADLAGDTSITTGDGMASIGALYQQVARLFRRKKPMVAAVQGAAIGAGLGLAVSADFRVASPAARFSANFVRLGFHPGFALTCTLPRLVGEQRAKWMMLSAERVKPDEAFAWGLVDHLATEHDLMDVARSMAGEIAANAPLALLAVRATLHQGLADQVEAALRHEHAEQSLLKQTRDYEEGVASVFERREARFTGS